MSAGSRHAEASADPLQTAGKTSFYAGTLIATTSEPVLALLCR
jgi:hypothetical protein